MILSSDYLMTKVLFSYNFFDKYTINIDEIYNKSQKYQIYTIA